jgi:hypothetical protein
MVSSLYGVCFGRMLPTTGIPVSHGCPLLVYNVMDTLKTYKGNIILISANSGDMLNGAWGYTAQEIMGYYQQAAAQGKARGIQVWLAGYGWTAQSSATRQDMSNVILNVGGAGDKWIADWSAVIRAVQPDGFDLINEPAPVSGAATPTFTDWRNFVIRAITAFKAVKPDLKFLVESYPYWDLSPWATAPLPWNDVYYGCHWEYYGGPPSTGDPQFAWWNAYYTGNLAYAKSQMEQWTLQNEGVQACFKAGLPILFDGSCTEMSKPNWDAWQKDVYDLSFKYGVGYLQFTMQGNPPDTHGILNSDWTTLNAMGQVWQSFLIQQVITYMLDVWQMAGGTTSPTGTQNVISGNQITITATPNPGYAFIGWLVNGAAASANPLALTITGPTTVIPQFQAIPTFTIGVTATAGGTTNPVPGNYIAASGSLTVTAIASAGYVFQNWIVDGQIVTTPTITVQYNANHQAQAVFIPAVGAIEVHAYSNSIEVNAAVIVGTQTQTTPFSMQVSAGSISLTCTYQGASLTQTVTVALGQTTKVSFNFTPVATSGISAGTAAVAGVVILAVVGFAALASTAKKK